MTTQDAPNLTGLAGSTVTATRMASPAETSARPVRRLPVQKDWPTAAILATQIGILVGAIALWEVAATMTWIDPFFWSQPSAIWKTFIIFFT